ncbi:MAG: methyltransferase [Pseudomonadota bacterium]
MKYWITLATLLLVAGCGDKAATDAAETTTEPEAQASAPADDAASADAMSPLQAALDAQPEEAQARYDQRHPGETLEFFGIEPGMTVMEGLPGGGWYTKILLPYLGSDGTVIGVDYALDMFPLFGFFSEERLEAKKTWTTDWVAQAEGWRGDNDASVEAFVFGSRDAGQFDGRADAVLMVRALHNLARFESEGSYLTAAMADAHAVLKSGGVLGVVQHEARAEMADEWAGGQNGYLKRDFVIAAAEAAGFEFVEASDINANPADQPTAEEFVWRLPPTLNGARDNPELRDAMVAIGESNRMTLKFVKP